MVENFKPSNFLIKFIQIHIDLKTNQSKKYHAILFLTKTFWLVRLIKTRHLVILFEQEKVSLILQEVELLDGKNWRKFV
jgi:hypothetical protein